MEKRKIKCCKRIISILSALVIFFSGFNICEIVSVADYITPTGYLSVDHNSSSCNIHTEYGLATCYIVTDESEQKLHYYTMDVSDALINQEQVMLVTNNSITIQAGITLYAYSSVLTSVTVKSGATLHVYDSNVNVTVDGGTLVLHGNSYPQMTVNSGDVIVADGVPYMMGSMAFTTGTLTVKSGARLEGVSSSELANATVTNNGTIQFLSSFEDNSASFTNNGTIEAASVKITTTTFTDSATASYKVKTGFEKGNFDLNGTVIPSNSDLWDNEDVTIKSAGGNTTVKLDGVTVTKTEAVDTTAGEFVPEPTITFTGWPSKIYVGQTINYKNYVQTDMGTATITFADATDSDGLIYGPEYTGAPTTKGKHKVIVKVPASTSYRATSSTYIFDIEYLTGVGQCSVDNEPVKDDGYSEYYNKPITLRAPDNFVIASANGESYDLTSTYTVSEDGYYMGQTGSFERVSDGARTESGWLYSRYFLIDQTPPQIVQSSARDQDGVAISTEIKNGVTLNARGVTFTVHDSVYNFGNTLSSVTVDGEPIFVNTDEGNAEVSLKRTFPGKETHQIIAKDDLGNTSTWNITLKYLPTATPETPFTVSGTEGKNGYYTSDVTLVPATGYTISADVNGTFTDTLIYKQDIENVYLMDVGGLYTAPIPVKAYLIDKKFPQFSTGTDESGNSIDITDGAEFHAKSISFDVTDENLTSVFVNSVPVEVNDGKAVIELAPVKGKTEDFEIYAEDIAGNAKYAKVTVEYLKNIGTVTVSMPDTYIGIGIEPTVTTNSDGEAVLYYKKDGTSDDTYTTVAPDAIGKYHVQARVPVTDGYTAAVDEDTFEISFLSAPSPAYTLSGEKDKNGNFCDDIIINAPYGYKIAKGFAEDYADSITYTDGLDKIYLKRASDGALTASVPFNESFMNEATVKVSVEDVYLGIKVKPVATTNSIGNISYYYKKQGASDDTYTTIIPNEVGAYTVCAKVAATRYYPAVTDKADFEITYLPAPKEAFTPSGKPGKNDYYTSDVELNAPEGFEISDELYGTYKTSITYIEGMDKIYLKRTDGALTGAIDLNKEYKIDKLAPETGKTGTLKGNNQSGRSIDIKNGISIFGDTLEFVITDENLMTIIINGEAVDFNEKTAKILLDANNRVSKFDISAEDKAGNVTSLSITLKATWLESNIIPAGASILLEAGQAYNLESGKWTVSGDSTVYNGGGVFYVGSDMDCVFSESK